MKPDFRQLYAREKAVFHIISKVEERGLAFDSKKARREAGKLQKKIQTEMKKIQQVAGLDFNPNSPAQVLKALRQLGLTDKQLTLKGKVTTGADVLHRVQAEGCKKRVDNFISSLLLNRAYIKTCNTYLLPLAKRAEMNDGIVYTKINPTDTRTGRMASREPNLQNIPTLTPRRGRTAGGENPVRSCFICRKGFANYYFDYSQMEIVLYGLYAGEPLITDTYKAGGDIHGVMCERLYSKDYTVIERDRTKDTNYGIIYGMGVNGMAQYRGVSKEEAREFLKFYHQSFPSITEFLEVLKYELKTKGYVEDWFGRHYSIPYGNAYLAISALIQGACAQIFKIALIAIDEYLDKGYEHILLPVHDEFQIEVKKANYWRKREERYFMTSIIDRMVNITELIDRDLILRVDVSKSTTNWAEKQKLEI